MNFVNFLLTRQLLQSDALERQSGDGLLLLLLLLLLLFLLLLLPLPHRKSAEFAVLPHIRTLTTECGHMWSE